MARFLLIHGSSHGAWCWSRLTPRLEALGHDVAAIDLPSHGDDPSRPEGVTIENYVTACLDALEDDTILVGHSLGGLTLTLAAARAPEKVRSLVYLCAWVPPPGVAFAEIRKDAITPEMQTGSIVDKERGVSIPKPEMGKSTFYHDCSDDDIAYATARLSPQPIAIMTETLDFEPPEVPRHYIRCLDDRVIKPSYQQAICADWPADHVHDMDCGHSPFFSDPDELAGLLHRISQT